MFIKKNVITIDTDTNTRYTRCRKAVEILPFAKGGIGMQRLIMKELERWKNSKRRKPLVLRGARQVGKTWVLQS